MSKTTRLCASALSFVAVMAMVFAGPALANHKAGHGSSEESTQDSDGRRDCEQNDKGSGGYYDADCYPEESENGSKTGDGSGKPCAGCVGKADNKNPPGQSPDENDSNKGYECDDNHGAGAQRGSGNPAHTGCRRDDTTPSPSPSPTPTPTPSTPCDADPNMAGIQECDEVGGKRVCDADPNMSGIQECDDDTPLCPEDVLMGAVTAAECVPVCPEDATMGDVAADGCIPPCPEDAAMGDVAAEECAAVEVEADQVCDKDPTMAGTQECGDDVLGRRFPATRGGPAVEGSAQEPGVLPFTGAGVDRWILVGLLLMVIGWLISRPGYLTRSRH